MIMAYNGKFKIQPRHCKQCKKCMNMHRFRGLPASCVATLAGPPELHIQLARPEAGLGSKVRRVSIFDPLKWKITKWPLEPKRSETDARTTSKTL